MSFFHWIFAANFTAMLVMRIHYRIKAVRSRAQVEYREGWLNMTIRGVFGVLYIGGVLGYIFYPAYLDWAQFSLPHLARWIGALLSMLSLALLWWVQSALDVHFDTTLHVQTGHKLVTHGPYRWVRHPMYTSLFLMGLGYLLLTANWMVGGLMLVSVAVLVWVRVPREEAMLIERFGQEYLDYMGRSGRFLPKLGRGSPTGSGEDTGSSLNQGFGGQ
jgi:protein-S-isoprenylcysteine O-methyltransferase Ste14